MPVDSRVTETETPTRAVFIVGSPPPMPIPKIQPEVLLRLPPPNTRPQTLSHPGGKVEFLLPIEEPPPNLTPSEKVEWLSQHTEPSKMARYGVIFLSLIDSLPLESITAQKYARQLGDSFIAFQKDIASGKIVMDKESLSAWDVVNFREQSSNLFEVLHDKGIISSEERQRLIMEGNMTTRDEWKLHDQQKKIANALEKAIDKDRPGEHALVVERVYNAVKKISHLMMGGGANAEIETTKIATMAGVVTSKAAPTIAKVVDFLQKKTSVSEGRNMMHSAVGDDPDKKKSLLKNLGARIGLGTGATWATAALLATAEIPFTWPVAVGIFGAAFLAPSIIDFSREHGLRFRGDKIDYRAAVRSVLRGVIPGAIIFGADALVRSALGVQANSADALLAVPIQLMALRVLAGSAFAMIGAQIGTESMLNAMDKTKGALNEFCQYLHFKDTDPERAGKLLHAEQNRKESRLPMFSKKGWEPLAKLANGEAMTFEEYAASIRLSHQLVDRKSQEFIDNPTRHSILVVDLGDGRLESIDQGEYLDQLFELQKKIGTQINGAAFSSDQKRQLMDLLLRDDLENWTYNVQRGIADRQTKTMVTAAGTAAAGSILYRGMSTLSDAVPELFELKRQLAATFLHADIPTPPALQVTRNVMGLAVEKGPELAPLLDGGGPQGEKTLAALRDVQKMADLDGLSLLWGSSSDKHSTALRSVLTSLSADGGGTISENDMNNFMTSLDQNQLTVADIRAVVTLAEQQGISDPVLDKIRGAASKGTGELIRTLSGPFDSQHLDPNSWNQQISRMVTEKRLMGQLYYFTSGNKSLLERLNIKATLEVQLMAAGVPAEKIPAILTKQGQFVYADNAVIFDTGSPEVFRIDPGYEKQLGSTFTILQTVLAGDGRPDYDKELFAALNNPKISYTAFLNVANAVTGQQPGWQYSYPGTDLFRRIYEEVGPNNKPLLDAAMRGDVRAFNQLVPLLKDGRGRSLEFLHPNVIHSSQSNTILDSILDRAKDRNIISERLKFFTSKMRLQSLASLEAPNLLIPNGPEIPYRSITSDSLLNGDVTIDRAFDAAFVQKGAVQVVGASGVEAKAVPFLREVGGDYPRIAADVLHAREGDWQGNHLDDGKTFLTDLFAKNYAAQIIPGRLETGMSDPYMQLVKFLFMDNDGKGNNVYGLPVVPGLFKNNYSLPEVMVMANQIWNEQPVDGVELIASTPGKGFIDTSIGVVFATKGQEGLNTLGLKFAQRIYTRQLIDAINSGQTFDFGLTKKLLDQTFMDDVWLGNVDGVPVVGFREAARLLFNGKDVNELTVPEWVSIVSLVHNPVSRGVKDGVAGYYYNYKFLSESEFNKAVTDGAKNVLADCRDKGAMSAEDYQKAKAVLDSGSMKFSWKLPADAKSDDFANLPVSEKQMLKATVSNATEIGDSGVVVQSTDLHRIPKPEIGEIPRAPDPGVQKVVDDVVNGYKLDPTGKYYVNSEGAILPKFEYWDPAANKVVTRPGIYYIVVDDQGRIAAEGGAAGIYGSKARIGSVEKLVAAIWLAYEKVPITTQLFDNSSPLSKTLDGAPLLVTNPNGGAGYVPFMSGNPANQLTIMEDLYASSNRAIQAAGRAQMLADTEAGSRFISVSKAIGATQYKLETDPVSGITDYVEIKEPGSLGFLGSDSWVDTRDFATKALYLLAHPEKCPDPRLRAALEQVGKDMRDDTLKRNFKSPGGPELNDDMFKGIESKVGGIDGVRWSKTGTTVLGAGETNDTGAAAVQMRSPTTGKSVTILTLVDAEKWNVTDSRSEHIPLVEAVPYGEAWGSRVAKPVADTVALNLAADAGIIPPLLTPDQFVLVKPGDSLYAIATAHGSTVKQLQALNGLGNSTLINPGQRLVLVAPPTMVPPPVVAAVVPPPPVTASSVPPVVAAPPPTPPVAAAVPPPIVSPVIPATTYTVKSGDTFSEIAARYGKSDWRAFARDLGMTEDQARKIRPGQVLTISPATKPSVVTTVQPPTTTVPKPPVAVSPVTPPEALASTTYTVQGGDVFSVVAEKFGYGKNWRAFAADLNMTEDQARKIKPGQVLTIPPKKRG